MSRVLNILFLGGAKRVSVGRKLIEAAEKRGLSVRIFGYELDPRVPLAAIGTIITGKKWSDPALEDHLAETVDLYGINMILPFVDGAIAPAARFTAIRRDVKCPVVNAGTALMLFDKIASARAFEEAGLPVPATWRKGQAPVFPLIAKPRWGSASKGIRIIHESSELDAVDTSDYLVQEYYENASEITVDCYISMNGEILAVSPRERLETAGGEAVRTVTLDDPEAESLAGRTIRSLNLRGAVTIQMLRSRDSGRLAIMEINPRLGGGVVASVKAGANIPQLIVDEFFKLPMHPLHATPGVMTTRYLEEISFLPDGTKI